jgi:hypothetical protein
MAFTAVGISDVTYALQKVILPYIKDNFPRKTILLDQLKRNAGTTFMNNQFFIPVRTTRHGGIAPLASDKAKLLTGSAAGAQASASVTEQSATFDISRLTIEATSTVKGAVENELQFQARTLVSDFARMMNRQFFGDGSGTIALANGAGVASASLTVKPVVNVNGDLAATKYIPSGASIIIGAGAAVTVNAVNTVTNVVTLAATRTWNDGDAIVLADGDGNQGVETSGLQQYIGTGTTYEALTRATTPNWTGNVDTTSTSLIFSDIELQYLKAKEVGEMDDKYAIFMNRTLYKAYADQLIAMRREVNETELLGGFEGLQFAAGAGKVGVFLDYDTPDGEVEIVNLDSLTLGQVSDMHFLEEPNTGALLRRPDAITYQAVMIWFVQLLGMAPAANARLTNRTK